MKINLNNKAVGFYLLCISGIIGIISLGWYILWGTANNMTNSLIVIMLILGIISDIGMIFYDSDYFLILGTGFYSVALFQLLSDSVGSFVDAFQGIVMFGNSSQVPTITSMSILIGISVFASILASFMKRNKI